HTVLSYFFVLEGSGVIGGIMYRTPVIIGKISPFRAKQNPSASRRGAVRPVGAYFPDNDRRSIHYPLLTPGSIARSLTILSLVRRFGQKCLLNDDVNVNVNPSSKTFLSYLPPCAMTQISH